MNLDPSLPRGFVLCTYTNGHGSCLCGAGATAKLQPRSQSEKRAHGLGGRVDGWTEGYRRAHVPDMRGGELPVSAEMLVARAPMLLGSL